MFLDYVFQTTGFCRIDYAQTESSDLYASRFIVNSECHSLRYQWNRKNSGDFHCPEFLQSVNYFQAIVFHSTYDFSKKRTINKAGINEKN